MTLLTTETEKIVSVRRGRGDAISRAAAELIKTMAEEIERLRQQLGS